MLCVCVCVCVRGKGGCRWCEIHPGETEDIPNIPTSRMLEATLSSFSVSWGGGGGSGL